MKGCNSPPGSYCCCGQTCLPLFLDSKMYGHQHHNRREAGCQAAFWHVNDVTMVGLVNVNIANQLVRLRNRFVRFDFHVKKIIWGVRTIYFWKKVHISLYFGCVNLYFGRLNLYRCTLGVWTYTLGVWMCTAVAQVSELKMKKIWESLLSASKVLEKLLDI